MRSERLPDQRHRDAAVAVGPLGLPGNRYPLVDVVGKQVMRGHREHYVKRAAVLVLVDVVDEHHTEVAGSRTPNLVCELRADIADEGLLVQNEQEEGLVREPNRLDGKALRDGGSPRRGGPPGWSEIGGVGIWVADEMWIAQDLNRGLRVVIHVLAGLAEQ